MADQDKARPADEPDLADDLVRPEFDPAADAPPEEHLGNGNGAGSRVAEPVGARSGGTRSLRRGATAATEAEDRGKGRPTPRREPSRTDQPRRSGPVAFVRESIAELRKVVYPTGPQLVNYFVVVLIFVLFVIAYVSLLDLGLGAAIFRLFA